MESKNRTGVENHEFCVVTGVTGDERTIYVKEAGAVYRLEYESAYSAFRGHLDEGFKGEFSKRKPDELAGYEDVGIGGEMFFLAIVTKSIQTRECNPKPRPGLLKTKAKKAPAAAAAHAIHVVDDDDDKEAIDTADETEEDGEYTEEGGGDEEEVEDEDNNGGGDGSRKKSSRSEAETVPPALKRSKTVSAAMVGDVIDILGSPPKTMTRCEDASYNEEIHPIPVSPLILESAVPPSSPCCGGV